MDDRSLDKRMLNRVRTITTEFVVFVLHIAGYIPSHFIRRFFYRLAGVKIGSGSALHTGIRFYNPRKISIGSDSIIGEGTVLDGRGPLKIGNHVDIATEVMIYNCEHDVRSENFSAVCGEVEIGDYVFIGPRAIILPGIKLGRGSVIGAGAVVTKDVQPLTIVGGVPAKEIGKRDQSSLNYHLGRAAWFR